MALGAFAISEDQNLLAYSVDHTGFRQYTLHIKDLRTGETLADTAERVGSIVWANDNVTLFYSVEEEETKRHYQLYRHTLGQPHIGGQPRLRRAGRALQPRRRQNPRQEIHPARNRQPHHQRSALHPRVPTNGCLEAHRAAPRQHRVLPRSPRRSLLHPCQRQRPELPPHHDARRSALQQPLA